MAEAADSAQDIVDVECGDLKAKLITEKLSSGTSSCIQFDGRLITPCDFEREAGKSTAKNWKKTIHYLKQPLSKFLVHDSSKRCCRFDPPVTRQDSYAEVEGTPVSAPHDVDHPGTSIQASETPNRPISYPLERTPLFQPTTVQFFQQGSIDLKRKRSSSQGSAGSQLFTEADFQEFYPQLVNCLPMKDPIFLADLYSQGFLAGDIKNKIENIDTQPAKATHFLDHVIKPSFDNNGSELFEKFIKLIGDSKSEVLKDLFKKIKKIPEAAHSEEGSSSSGATNSVVGPPAAKKRKVDGATRELKKKLTCLRCNKLFTEPKTLKCLHTFCKKCIEKFMKSTGKTGGAMYCPLCFIPLPQTEVADIPTNISFSYRVEVFSVQKEIKAIHNCGNCEGANPAVMYCKDCKFGYCEECLSSHKRMKMFKTHKTYSVENSLRSPEQIEKPKACSNHSSNLLDQYCRNCDRLICQDCLEDHSHDNANNAVCSMNDFLAEERSGINKSVVQLKEQLKLVKKAITGIENCEKEITTNCQKIVKKIEGKHDEVLSLLEKQKNNELKKVKTYKRSLHNTLALQKEQLKLMEIQMSTCEEFSTDAVKDSNANTLTGYREWIVTRVDELLSQGNNTALEPECAADKVKVEMAPPFSMICSVSPDIPIVSICGPIVRPQQVKIVLKLKDIVQSPVEKHSDNLKIRCSYGIEFLQDLQIKEISSGCYHVLYQPNQKISHFLSVYWQRFALHKDRIRVPINIRDYVNIKEAENTIEKYGPNNKEIRNPYLLGKGPSDMFFIRDDSSKQLVVFSEHLKYLYAIGGEGNGKGKFRDIAGIACAHKNGEKLATLYVADGNLNCIQVFKWNTGKKRFEFDNKEIGGYGSDDGQFQFPCGLCLTQSGRLFVCDRDNHRIQVYDNEKFSRSIGKHGTDQGDFNKPIDITMNTKENQIFVSDSLNNRIQVLTSEGAFLTIFGNHACELQNPVGVDFSPDGHLLVCCNGGNCISVFEEDGELVNNITGLSTPCGIVIMNNGRIVAACGESNNIVIF